MNSTAVAIPYAMPIQTTLPEQHLQVARQNAGVLDQVIERYGHRDLGGYMAELRRNQQPDPHDRDDLQRIVVDYTTRLLGGASAQRVCEQLERSPCALTANHHGVDFFAQSVQGTLTFSHAGMGEPAPVAVPVFACGIVPLDNLTYPLGMLFYAPAARDLESVPYRLPIFSNKARRALVCEAGAITPEMIQRAGARIKKLISENLLATEAGEVALDLLQTDYSAPEVLDLADYSNQAVILNHRIWRRLHNHAEDTPELIYLELERITSELLQFDLADPDSLAAQVLFDDTFRSATVNNLDTSRACWDHHALADRLRDGRGGDGAGTMFFWGMNEKGRRVPLCLDDNGQLAGIDDKGKPFTVAFERDALIEGLRNRSIAPALFLSFLALSFARGIRCLGGYYQAEYLPAMQDGVARALELSHDTRDRAADIRSVATQGYLGGMQSIMQRVDGRGLMPAGIMEMLAAGGLTDVRRQRARGMTVYDAHLASLLETLNDLGLDRRLAATWRDELAQASESELAERVVVI